MVIDVRLRRSTNTEFRHIAGGQKCSDNAMIDLSNKQECSDAVTYVESFNGKARFAEAKSWDNYPKGCFMCF